MKKLVIGLVIAVCIGGMGYITHYINSNNQEVIADLNSEIKLLKMENQDLQTELNKQKKEKKIAIKNESKKVKKAVKNNLTPITVEVTNDGATITYKNGTGYFLESNAVNNKAIRYEKVDHSNCITKDDITYMSKNKYDYYELELKDDSRYHKIAKDVNWTKKQEENKIKSMKAGN